MLRGALLLVALSGAALLLAGAAWDQRAFGAVVAALALWWRTSAPRARGDPRRARKATGRVVPRSPPRA